MTQHADSHESKAPKILLVDDERYNLEYLRRAISRNFRVFAAESGDEGLEVLDQHEDVFLIISDQRMAGMNGSEFLKEACRKAPNSIRVLMTGYGDYEAVVDAINLGKIWNYVRKPVKPEEVQEVVDASLEMYRVRTENRRLTEELVEANRQLQQQKELLEARLDDRARELLKANESLQALTVRDTLTGLYNHRFFQDRLGEELARAERREWPVTVMLIDVDHFKAFNEAHGHERGDAILRETANLLTGATDEREFSFRESDVVARYGADVVSVILTDCTKSGALKTAERARLAFERRVAPTTNEGQPKLSVSIGLAQYPVDADTKEHLVDCAQQALYTAKRDGRNCAIGFQPGTVANAGSERRPQIREVEDLEDAIRTRAFCFHFQPIVDLKTEEVFGYEALCRPSHPSFGGPAALFATAEQLGAVTEVGRAARSQLLEYAQFINGTHALFVNLHPEELWQSEGLAEELQGIASRTVLEITETSGIADFERVARIIEELKSKGFRIALDDFGAGYSSINRIAKLSPDMIKLDIELVRSLKSDSTTARLVSHLLEFTNSENIPVIAEGIESEAERDAVTQLGCTLGQGFLLGRPAPDLGTQTE
jgi:diguanylate cyclase (GGDEF)-like protein